MGSSFGLVIAVAVGLAAAAVYYRPPAVSSSPSPSSPTPTPTPAAVQNNSHNIEAIHAYAMAAQIRESLAGAVDPDVPVDLSAPRVQAESGDDEVRACCEWLVERLSQAGSTPFVLIHVGGAAKEVDEFGNAYMSVDFVAHETTTFQTIRLAAAVVMQGLGGRAFVVSLRPWNTGFNVGVGGTTSTAREGEYSPVARYTPK